MKLATSLPIANAVRQLLEVLGDGLPVSMGVEIAAPTGGLLAAIDRSGESLRIKFADTGRPSVSFNGHVTEIVISESKLKATVVPVKFGQLGFDIECDVR